MSSLIVIRIIPQQAVTPLTFSGYLKPAGLGPLRITAFDLSFSDPVGGKNLGTVSFIAPTTPPSPTIAVIPPPTPTFSSPQYTPDPTGGIIQQYDLQPPATSETAFYELESVATAVIEVPSATTFENLRIVAQWGSGAGATPVPVGLDFYDVAVAPGPVPDLNAWNPSPFSTSPDPQRDPWADLPPSLYLQLPAPPAAANPFSFQLKSDGTPPAFDDLLNAVNQILKSDPGGAVTATTTAPAAAGSSTLQFPASTAGIAAGMSMSAAGIPAGATVVKIDATGLVTLSEEVSAAVPAGTTVTFTANLGALSVEQCRNIAFEIVWSQQPPPPTPPEKVEFLYSDPPNTGSVLKTGTPNVSETGRLQFEGELKSYYALANAAADRLTNFVYTLSAAVACEQQSLAATEVLLRFPANPGVFSPGSPGEPQVLLTGIGGVAPPANFGVPAAYFYGLGAQLPLQVTAPQRFKLATGNQLDRILADLTSAINAATVTDSEQFVMAAPPGINAAQAARRIVALGVSARSFTPLAPLDSLALPTVNDVAKGATLPFASTAGVNDTMSVSGPNIAAGAKVLSLTATSVTLDKPVLDDVPPGTSIVFTAPYTAGLTALIKSWLDFPQAAAGEPSTQTYQSGDDDTQFWPVAAGVQPAAFLNLVLSALTEGFIIPPPFGVALGDMITSKLLPSPTVAALAAVSGPQWTDFFQKNPAFLPPGTGDIEARIAAFIRRMQTFFAVGGGGVSAPFVLPTIAIAAGGALVLDFAPTAAIMPGMSVSGLNIPPGDVVKPGVTTTSTATSVTLTAGVMATVPAGTYIEFRVSVSGAAGSGLPTFPAPSRDWLADCLSAYGAFTLGSGFDVSKLQAAAATVFPGDQSAQNWVVDAIVTLDALYQVVKSVTLPSPGTQAVEFSVVEALYARGFTSAAQITELTSDQFGRAVIGTVAFECAGSIYTSASAIAPPVPPIPPAGGFVPVNPDGLLTNCIPPPCSSPLGPVAYLSELLALSATSTCDSPFPPPVFVPTSDDTAAGSALPFVSTTGVIVGMSVTGDNIPDATTVTLVSPTSVTISNPVAAPVPKTTLIAFTAPLLGSVLSLRRGPIGNLAASCTNLETPLPLIDMVNESLEFMAAQASPVSGTVYDTSPDALAGHVLCQNEPCPEKAENPFCHDPARIFAALPEYSTPATPVSANSAVEPAVYDTLAIDFSACSLPYSQAIDVSRTYLRHFRSCRFEEMRTFRKCITEFVLDPVNEPAGFESYLWRYPVRIDTAIEYLGITPAEYVLLFGGAIPPLCDGASDAPRRGPREGRGDGPAVWTLYGFASPGDNDGWIETVVQLPEFLARACLSYCEFYELWQSGFVQFTNSDQEDGSFPECEPCCPDRLSLQFGDGEGADEQGLLQLAIFIRLWRKLRDSGCFCYTFFQLRDICDVLQLFIGTDPNPDFIRELAAFQMLRDQFRMELTDPGDKPPATAIDAGRTHLLSLWVGPTAAKWGWAVRQLSIKVVHYAEHRHKCERRSPEFIELLNSRLDPFSRLAGFDPVSATDSWHARPTNTLRFAETLAKLAASNFRIPEIFYLFTIDDHPDCSDLFPLQEENESLELPLDLPDDDCEFSLWRLRRELLNAAAIPISPAAEISISVAADKASGERSGTKGEWPREGFHIEARISEDCADEWDWRRVAAVLQEELGFSEADILDFGRHFFPHVLEKAGYLVAGASARFVSGLAPAKTTPSIWSGPGEGPFEYDVSAEQLWTRVPLSDHAVIAQLTRLQSLNADEQNAVQDLYFQPRAMLALFGVLIPDFPRAVRQLIEEPDASERWNYFRRHVAQCHQRCHIIARHLSRHVEAVSGQKCPESEAAALLILRELFGDENKAIGDWENDDGSEPPVTWTPPPNGGAFAALLGLLGTGLVAEYKVENGGLVWRDVSGSLRGFGRDRDHENAPVPTVLPSLAATIGPPLSTFVSVRNGFLVKNAGGALLGGAQGFDVTWSGALLVDEEGQYEFWAGAPVAGNEKPDCEPADRAGWRVVLKRGSRSWVLLSRRWPGEEDRRSAERHLRRGAYDLTVELVRPGPDFTSENQVHPLHTGLEVKYSGPDTGCERVPIPHRQLFSTLKEQTLSEGVGAPSPGAALYLARYYTSSFRDIRRTYQRAFKALLFAHRFALSARRDCETISELGYMLDEKVRFAGASYFRSGTGFTRHAANFDFNFLPVADDYHAPASDSRAKPSQKRSQALWDWWERTYDYTVARDDVRRRSGCELWRLFAEARAAQPSDPASLLGRLEIDQRFRRLLLRYYQGQSSAVYPVSSSDLEDARWGVRVWHSDRWIRALHCHFAAKDWTTARPDLWASDDPGATVSAETETGNANLSAFLCNGCLENGDPRRYDELKRVNDGLRERGRKALSAFLCSLDRVPLPWSPGRFANVPRDLSDLLLLDVEAGVCEKASRIDDAITAVQNFIRRARLHLEPGWTVTPEFARMWDREFATFHVWQSCQRRNLYIENWIEWSDLEKARGVEAFRFLDEKLRSSTLTVAVPGGSEWWPGARPPAPAEPRLLQKREPSALQILPAPYEGLNLLGTPERDARPAWLAAVEPAGLALRGAAGAGGQLPLWMEAAIRLGTAFYRVAAAGVPPAAMLLQPHKQRSSGDCVTCCEECGCCHPDLVDEYYFWLVPAEVYEPAPAVAIAGAPTAYVSPGGFQNGYQDDFYDGTQQQSAVWQDTDQLPQLLEWQPTPAVRLAWCRIHNGEFQQPRRSPLALRVRPGTDSDLTFLGRTADSLTFSVTNGIPPIGYADPSSPGFRFDLAADDAVPLPEAVVPATPPKFLGSASLPVYPWFLFDAPGASLVPLSPFSPSLAVAKALRPHCRFEAALAWYRQAFDPLRQDCTWVDCNQDELERRGSRTRISPFARIPGELPEGDACCDSTDITCDQARDRSVVLQYLETLVEWSDAVMRRGNSAEAFQEARVILDTAGMILGKAPRAVKLPEPSVPGKVSDFSPAFPSLNPRLLDIYEIVRSRLENIRACTNAYRLRNSPSRQERAWFGNDPLREGWRSEGETCAEEGEWCFLRSPYRFLFLVQKAQEYASKVQELGSALMAAFEKGDAEYLASLRASQERELFTLGLEARKDMWRDADWQIEALQKTKAVSQANLVYYNGLITGGPGGLIGDEINYQNLMSSAISLRGTANITEGVGEALRFIPDIVLGAAGFGGTPVAISWIPLGTKIGEALEAVARIMNNSAEINSLNAGVDQTDASWQRRLDEWTHQTQNLTIEIQQVERQILGAERRRDQALQDLNSDLRRVEQSAEVLNFLRDKFSAHDLYLFLQKESAALYYKTYDLALYTARQTQHAFNLERGHTTRRFIPECAWDDLHEGLMAGERLSVALRHMEKAYLDENVREYELTRNFSLRLHFPMAFLRLRTTGFCEVDIPEWMFDLDFPGHYMRRIRNVTITIPCVTGPYTGVHCRLTLISSMTRIDPRLSAPPHECCCPPEPYCNECSEDERLGREYLACPDDPRIVRQYGAREAVATSSGQNDSGLFQLDFSDSRYLPFEYMGAVSRWRIELPAENNFFERHTLSDMVLRFNLLAREGGPVLRRAASAAARHRLPGDGWNFLDVRHEFPNAWQLFEDCSGGGRREGRLRLRLDRKMFPFVPGGREILISSLAILFGKEEDEGCDCPMAEGCPCPEHGRRAWSIVEFSQDDDRECRNWREIHCRTSEPCSGLYYGIVDAHIGRIGGKRHHAEIEFRFPTGAAGIEHVFLLCRYMVPGSVRGACTV